MAQASELALEPDSRLVVRPGLDRVEWCAALRIGVMMIVRIVSYTTVVVPAGHRIDEP